MVELYEGCWGRRRDGKVVGPMRPIESIGYPWTDGRDSYKKNGRFLNFDPKNPRDIIKVYPSHPLVDTNDAPKSADELSQLQEENQRLQEALSFYAEPATYRTTSTGFAVQYDPEPPPIQSDLGQRARTALSTNPEAPNQ